MLTSSDKIKILKWFTLQNTGWSGGISWFDSSNGRDEQRYETFQEAQKAYKQKQWGDESVKWRIVEVIFTRYFQDELQPLLETNRITQERYLYVNQTQET